MQFGTRTLRVQGVGIVEQTPDIIILSFDIVEKNYEYEKAIGDVSARTDMLKNNLLEIGIPKGNVKTSSFNINTVYRHIDKDKQVFDGYKCIHSLDLEIPMDTELLRKAVNKVVSSGIDVEFHMRFSVKDKDELKKRVLASAMKDAMSKAEIMSNTAGFQLGNIISVNNELRSINYYSRNELCLNSAFGLESAMPDITPQDITASDRVNIEWEIL